MGSHTIPELYVALLMSGGGTGGGIAEFRMGRGREFPNPCFSPKARYMYTAQPVVPGKGVGPGAACTPLGETLLQYR